VRCTKACCLAKSFGEVIGVIKAAKDYDYVKYLKGDFGARKKLPQT
jgi:hypothetical protein